jgi:hypothetical protein
MERVVVSRFRVELPYLVAQPDCETHTPIETTGARSFVRHGSRIHIAARIARLTLAHVYPEKRFHFRHILFPTSTIANSKIQTSAHKALFLLTLL